MAFQGADWWFILLGLTEILLLIIAIGWALVTAATRPYPGLLVTSLSLLTLMLLVVYVITKQGDVITLIGVPLGALATAMSGVFKPDPTHHPVVKTTTVTEPSSDDGVAKTTVVTEQPVTDDGLIGLPDPDQEM